MRAWICIGATVVIAFMLWGCSFQAESSVARRLEIGDRELEWGMVFYRSWLRERNGKYLRLARRHTADAVVQFFEIQFDLGHAYPDFYIIDRRRRQGCRFLREIDVAAERNRVRMEDTDREGCLK